MARHPFAGTADDYVQENGQPLPGRSDDLSQVLVSGRAYTARVGGTQITDLQTEAGVAITDGVLVPDQFGYIPRFLGPDNRSDMWLDFGTDRGRFLINTTDLPARVTTLETSVGTLSGLPTQVDALSGTVDTHETRLDVAEPKITTLQTSLTSLTTRVTTAESDIDTLQAGGGGGGTTQPYQPPATAIVYSANFRGSRPATNTAEYRWTCTGTGDQAQINAAITAVENDGGGRVLLLGPTFNITGSILMRTNVHLDCGMAVIKATSDFQAGMVMLQSERTRRSVLSHFNLNGNGQQVHGIHYVAAGGQVFYDPDPPDNPPFPLLSTNPDPAHVITNGNIYSCGDNAWAGHGMRMQGGNLRAGKYDTIRILGTTGTGVWVDQAVDSHYTNIEVGSTGNGSIAWSDVDTAPVGHAFFIHGDQNSFLGCKGWFARGCGYKVRAVRTRLNGCEAQDNYSFGFDIMFLGNVLSVCSADSNGQYQDLITDPKAGRGAAGFMFRSEQISAGNCISFDRRQGDHGPRAGHNGWQQEYGYQWTTAFKYSALTGCISYQNQIDSSLGATNQTGLSIQIIADDTGK